MTRLFSTELLGRNVGFASNYFYVALQDKLGKASLQRKRKLYDNEITNVGYERLAVRLKVTEDMYGDETVEVLSSEKIVAIINYPGDVPLFTDRDSAGESSRVGSFVYDFLPIEGYFRFKDNVQPGDIIVMRIFDDTSDGFIQAFRISEVTGNAGIGVVAKTYNLAPYNLDISKYPEIESLINDYEQEAFV